MKKLILLLTVVSLFFSLHAINVSAASDNPVVAKYDSANTALFVNADFGSGNADILTTITLFKAGETLGDDSLPMLFQSEFTNDDGVIDVSISIPSFFSSDKYTVRIANSIGTYDTDFLYAKNSDIRDVMLLLNGAQTNGEISGIITSNYQKLALDPVVVSPYVSELSKAYKEICSQTNYTNETVFYSDFMQCLAAAEIACGDDVTTVLNRYKLYIGSAVDEIKTYPSSVQTLLVNYISNADYSDGLLSEQIPKLRALAFFKSSATWGEAKLNILGVDASGAQVTDNFDVISADLTYYNRVNGVNLIYEKLFSQRNSISTFDALKTAFETISKSVYDSEQSSPSRPSGGGGSSFGGASVPSATVTPGTKPQDTVPANPVGGTVSSRFSDISTHWAKDYIEELADANVISGYPDGTFGPDKNVSRAEFAKLIMAYSGLEADSNTVEFNDVKADDWFYVYVAGAYNHGFINGISANEFSPNTPITRQDACVIIYRYLGDKISCSEISSFADSDMISDYALDAISALCQNGILTGYVDGTVKPKNYITRAETAIILSRVTDYLN